VRIKRIGLPNIVLDKDLLPELIQKDCNPRNIVKTVLETLDNPDKISLIKKELSQLKALLGDRKTSIEMLNLVKKMLETYA
jgi:lipid-A-disaccharide synthase